MHQQLRQIAQEYIKAKERIIELEGRTALSPLTARTFSDIRSILDHTLIGILIADDPVRPPQDVLDQYDQALLNLRYYPANAFQAIAGKSIEEAQSALEKGGALCDDGRARNLLNEAIQHYNLGRQCKSLDPNGSLASFDRASDLARDSKRCIVPAGRPQRLMLWLTLLLLLVGVVTVIILMLK